MRMKKQSNGNLSLERYNHYPFSNISSKNHHPMLGVLAHSIKDNENILKVEN